MTSPILGAPWTTEEIAILRASYLSGGIVAARAALPHRTEHGIYRAAQKQAFVRSKRWTPDDDAQLRDLWGELSSVAKIAKRIKRTPATTYWRAQKIGLPLGATQGREYLTTAATRLGFAVGQLRTILAWAGVRITRAMARPTNAKKRLCHVVDELDATEAVERWMKTETLHVAATTRGLDTNLLRGLLLAAGETSPKRRRQHWRIATEVIERVVEQHRAKRSATESVMQGALRIGVTRQTLTVWLEEASTPRGSEKVWRVSKDLVDEVARVRRQRPGSRAPGRRAA